METVNAGPYEENGDECWYGVYEGEPNSRMVDFSKTTVLKTSGVPIDTAHFPDVNFRSYVSTNCDTNGDGALSSAEIAGVKKIQVKESQISSLEGIEVFTALEELDCSKNRLNSLDISALSGLKNLNCSHTPLTTLDVTHCPELKVLKCSTCALSELDISNCPKLFWLEAPWNNLSALDLSSNPALKSWWRR